MKLSPEQVREQRMLHKDCGGVVTINQFNQYECAKCHTCVNCVGHEQYLADVVDYVSRGDLGGSETPQRDPVLDDPETWRGIGDNEIPTVGDGGTIGAESVATSNDVLPAPPLRNETVGVGESEGGKDEWREFAREWLTEDGWTPEQVPNLDSPVADLLRRMARVTYSHVRTCGDECCDLDADDYSEIISKLREGKEAKSNG